MSDPRILTEEEQKKLKEGIKEFLSHADSFTIVNEAKHLLICPNCGAFKEEDYPFSGPYERIKHLDWCPIAKLQELVK